MTKPNIIMDDQHRFDYLGCAGADNDKNELYDLAADPDEMYNVVDEQAELALELHQMMKERMKEGKWLQ